MITPTEEAQILMQGSTCVLPIGASTTTAPWAQAFDRRFAISAVAAPASGTMQMTSIMLPAGRVVTGISFVSGSTAESGGTHLWFALYRGDNLALLAQSTDDTAAAAFAANTMLRKALTTPQTLPYSGLYYLAYCSTNSAGAQPTLINITSPIGNNNGITTAASAMTPTTCGTSTTGLAASAPSTAAALATGLINFWACVD